MLFIVFIFQFFSANTFALTQSILVSEAYDKLIDAIEKLEELQQAPTPGSIKRRPYDHLVSIAIAEKKVLKRHKELQELRDLFRQARVPYMTEERAVEQLISIPKRERKNRKQLVKEWESAGRKESKQILRKLERSFAKYGSISVSGTRTFVRPVKLKCEDRFRDF